MYVRGPQMDWDTLIYLIPYLISLAISTTVGVFAWRRRDVKGAGAYAGVALSQAFWTLGYTCELLSPGLQGKILWDDLQWLGGVGWFAAFLAFAIEYASYKLPHPRRFWVLVEIVPVAFILLVATNSLHGWIRSEARLVPGEPFSALEYDFTLVVWAWAIYGYAMLLVALRILIARYVRTRGLYRAQLGAILVGTLLPLVGTVLTLTGVTLTFHRDTTPLTFALGNLIVAMGLFRYRLFDLLPIARDTAVESMPDAVLVLDANDRLVDLNPAAQEMIGQQSSQAIGQPADRALAAWPDLVERFRDVREARAEVVVDEDQTHLDLSISSLYNDCGLFTGRLIVARDITERWRRENEERRRIEQLRAINEVGRHITSILDVDELLTEIARTAQSALGYRLVGLALIEGDELVFREGAGGGWEIPAFQPPRLKVGQEGITGWVAHAGEPLLVPDVHREPRYYASPWAPDVRSELAVPLKTKEQVIGVLHAQSTHLNAFDESDLAVLQTLAHQAAIAIENARSYASAQQELAARRQAEAALRKAHDELEQRVEERTAELAAANLSLRKEIVQRGRAEAQRDATMAALQENEEHYRTLFESVNDALFVLLQDRFLDCNPAAEAMFGYGRDFLVGKTPYQLAPPYQPDGSLSRQAAMDRIEAALAGTPQAFEWVHRRADGTLFDTEVNLNRMQVGGEWMTLAAVRDITERKRAEEELRQSNERWQTYIERANDLIFICDASGKITSVNRATCEVSGYTPDELLGKSPVDFAVPEARATAQKALDRVLRGGDGEQGEWQMATRDGHRIWVEVRGRLIHRGQPHPSAFFIGRDMTERRKAAEALRESEERYRLLAENVDDVLWVRDASMERYIYISPSIERLLGYAPEEMLDKPLSEFIAPGSYSHVQQAAQRRLADEAASRRDDETHMFEVEYVRKDGSTVWVESRTVPLRDEDGQFQGLIGVTRDISARKRVEQALRHYAERLEVLHEIDQGILAAHSPEEIARAALEHIRQLVPCQRASVALIERSSGTAIVVASDGKDSDELGEVRMSIDRFKHLPSLELQGMILSIEDLPAEEANALALRVAGVREILAVPLVFQNDQIGVLSLGLVDAGQLRADQVDIIRQVADQLAIAIANARLLGSERAQRQVAETLLETSTAVASTLNIDQVLLALASRLRNLSAFHACMICEVTPSDDGVCGLAEHARSVWPPGGGNVYHLDDYPAIQRVLVSARAEVTYVDDEGLSRAERSSMEGMGITTLLNLPLYAGHQVIGLAEVGHAVEGTVFDAEAVARCRDILSEAATWLAAPLASNDQAELLELSRRLAEAAGGTNCNLLSWQPTDETVQTTVVCTDLVWPYGTGPVYSLSAYPAMARVLASGKPMVTWPSRPQNGVDQASHIARWGEQTVVLLPLRLRGVHVGLLELADYAREREVTDQELRLWQTVADQTTIALENARLYAQSQRHAEELEQHVADRTRELQTMYEVMSIASQQLDLDTMLAWSLERVLEAVRCEAGGIHLLDEQGMMLHLAVHQGAPLDLVSQVLSQPADRGVLGWTVQHGEPIVVPDLVADPHTAIAPRDVPLAYAGVPLRAGGRTLGVLSVIREATVPPFDEAEVALLTSLAERVGAVVESAQLRQRAEQAAVLEERHRLARDLHDSVTQSLYSLTLLAETGRRSALSGDLDGVANYVGRLGQVSQQALKEMRLLIYELRPPVVEQEGLAGALQQRLDAVEGRAGIEARLLIEGEIQLDASVEDDLYRIAVEALNNALKHAAATLVTVHICGQDGITEVEVADNGLGFDPETAGDTGGMGLATMRERAEQLGGTLEIVSTSGKGTRVKVRVGSQDSLRALIPGGGP
jgi:PAS domain S-box-containing protein